MKIVVTCLSHLSNVETQLRQPRTHYFDWCKRALLLAAESIKTLFHSCYYCIISTSRNCIYLWCSWRAISLVHMLNNVIAKKLFSFNVYLRSWSGTEMETFYLKRSRHYIIQGDSCLVNHIPKQIYFNFVHAELDSLSVTHFISGPIVKSLPPCVVAPNTINCAYHLI